ncbi:hypothetical protein TTRE_0000654401 [Trichuris trichiura]|uniref:Uncharacterized protein n=1 Tax=Trichuris trichiura TaxID=36087 RepID=A0A077ZD12_TRITR|nr:hypothetical protein TTRE_0000654401 [Trichuris trichiura]
MRRDTKLLGEVPTPTSPPSRESSRHSGEPTSIREPSVSSDVAEGLDDSYDLAPLRTLHDPYDRASLDFKFVDENAQRLSREYPPPIPLHAT